MCLSLAVAAVPLASGWVCAQAEDQGTSQGAMQDLLRQETVLVSRDSGQSARDEAARRLVSRESPEARQILLRVLSNPANEEGQLAVARALASAQSPDPEFIGPLGDLLASRKTLTTEPAAQALANFKDNPQAVARLTAFVTRDVRVPPAQRAVVVKAMGRMVDKSVAGLLVGLLNSEPQGLVKSAAIDALVEMTALPYGQDVQSWNAWWATNRDAPELEWAKGLLRKNNQEAKDLLRRLDDTREALKSMIAAEYGRSPQDERAKVLASHLKSTSEDERVVTLRVIMGQAGVVGSAALPDSLKETLRGMVGDSSTEVRRQAADTLAAVNDTGAVTALLTQLAQEKDTQAKAAILRALGLTNDMRAQPALVAALDDPSYAVANAAATGIKAMADELRKPANAAAAQKTADALRAKLDELTKVGIAAQDLRTTVVIAMASLGHPSLARTFAQLTSELRDPPQVRRYAYQGLKNIGDPKLINQITPGLHDIDAGVRRDAVDAMSIGSFEDARAALEPMLSPSVEPDLSVRNKAWQVLEGLFPKATPEGLNGLASVCSRLDPQRSPGSLGWEASALAAAVDKLDKAGQAEKAATIRQNLGDVLLKLKRPDDAAAVFREALKYWDSVQVPQAVKEPVRLQLMRSLLAAKKYADAMAFATTLVDENTANEPAMWGVVNNEIRSLQTARDWDSALQLIAEARKATPFKGRMSTLAYYEEQLNKARGGGGWLWRTPAGREMRQMQWLA